MNNLDDTEDFRGFILDLPAKYYKDLSLRMRKQVLELLVEYLETDKINYVRNPKIHTFVLIGLISVSKLLEMKDVFKNTVLFSLLK